MTTIKRILLVTGLVLTAVLLPAAGGDGGSIDGAGIGAVLDAIDESPLSVAEKEGILFMREEEKLARDVYNHLFETWNIPIFRNIARSEQTHINTVGSVIERYGLTDPLENDVPGLFQNPELQKLYDNLTAAGDASLEAALAVGVEIEDLDIYDLRKKLAGTDNNDLKIVYLNLEKGSRNHLRSFYSQLIRRGGAYEARHITPDLFDRIIESPGERAGVIADPNFVF